MGFMVRFGAMVIPLFLPRDFMALLDPPAQIWQTWKQVTLVCWYPWYYMCACINTILDTLFGEKPAFSSIENSIPWGRLAKILCCVKEDFARNRLLASLDFVYPISAISSLTNTEREAIQVKINPHLAEMPVKECNHDLWRECREAVQYATSSYFLDLLGPPKNVEIKLGPFMPAQTTVEDTFDAGYYVAFDKENERLILCIRGSTSIADFGTDIDAEPTTMIHVKGQSYAVHRGIWIAARRLDARIKDTLIETFNDLKGRYRNLELMITGHSLGAGVSSLLGLIWYYGLSDDISEWSSIDPDNGIKGRFYCYSFASPPVIDASGRKYLLENMIDARTGQHIITSIANQMDIVTRMSIPGLYDASNKIEWIGSDINNYGLIESIERKRCDSTANFIELIQKYANEIDLSDPELIKDIDAYEQAAQRAKLNIFKNNVVSPVSAGIPPVQKPSKQGKKSMQTMPTIPVTVGAGGDTSQQEQLFTEEELEFIFKFITFQNPEQLGLSQSVIDNQKEHKYVSLYPCGLVVWRVPRLPWGNVDAAYQQVSSVITANNLANRLICWMGHVWNDMFGSVDTEGNYKDTHGSGKSYFTDFELYRMDGKNVLNNFNVFRNMVINTGAAVMDHAQGQYSSTFGLNLSTVFKNSSRPWVRWLPDANELFVIKVFKCGVAASLCAVDYLIANFINVWR